MKPKAKTEARGFRIESQVILILESLAYADDRSLNYIVNKILKKYVETKQNNR